MVVFSIRKDKDTEYNLDHNKPANSFNLEDSEERKKCCHWTNLEWLTEKENNKKRDTIPTKEEIEERQAMIDEFQELNN